MTPWGYALAILMAQHRREHPAASALEVAVAEVQYAVVLDELERAGLHLTELEVCR